MEGLIYMEIYLTRPLIIQCIWSSKDCVSLAIRKNIEYKVINTPTGSVSGTLKL